MEIVDLEISSLIHPDYNPRQISKNDYEQLKQSLLRFECVDPAVVNIHDERKGVIVGGNQRVTAARELGWKTFPCVCVSLDEKHERELNVRLNKNTGEWDFDILANNFNVEDLLKWGFVEEELVGSFIDRDGTQGLTDDNSVPDAPVEPKTRTGDIYKLGNHRLMCGDSTMISDVEKLMGGVLVDLFITDPPYNVDYVGKTKDSLKIKNDKMEGGVFRQFLSDCFGNANIVMKGGAVFYIWHADLEGYNFRGACFDVGWTVRQCLIWNKNSMVMGRQDYHWKHEPCLYGWKDGDAHLWASDRKQVTVLDFVRPTQNKIHPTMKPVELFEYQICNNTKQSDVVLDLFCGSGTSIIACEKKGRHCYGMELDPKYCDVIVERWEQFTGDKAELLNVTA